MKKITLLLLLSFFPVGLLFGIEQSQEDFLPIGLTEEEKTRLHEIGINHRVTAPPTGNPRNPAEWEPSEGVIIRWPLGISIALVAELSEDVMVTTIVANSAQQSDAISDYTSGGVTMSNTDFIIADTDSIWTRDYGPWFIFEDATMAIVDHIYNRPRPDDDVIPQVIGTEWSLNVYGMDLNHTGGNHMSEGLGTSMSTELVYNENTDKTPAEVDQEMFDYLGNDYTVLDYIQSGGIHHIDCWAKFLGPDTVLVKDVPSSDPSYDELNARATYLSGQMSAWGVPYTVVRVYCPSGTYYTNSLILNGKVLVPIFGDSQDSVALQTYEDAMPGYEVLGFTGSWASEDALHCRTMGVPDRGMLFMDHVPFRTEDITTGDYLISGTIIPCSGANLISSELKIYYSVDGGLWTYVLLSSVGSDTYEGYIPAQSEGAVISYYLEAEDDSGRIEKHPYIGQPWAHQFTAICPNHPLVDVAPDGPLLVCTGTGQVLTAVLTGGSGPFSYQWTEDGSDLSGATDSTYTASNTGTHGYNCKVWGNGCISSRSDGTDIELTWQTEPLFSGLTSVINGQDATCTLDLAWSAATPACGGPVTYNIYRSTTPGFTPDSGNLLVSGISATTFSDTIGLVFGTTYYYIVRAEDDANGVEDSNVVELSGSPTGSEGGPMTLFSDDFEDGGTWSNWTVTTGPGPHTCGDWDRVNTSSQRPPNSTGYYALSDSDACGSGTQTSTDLWSPVIDCGIAGLTSVTLEYDLYYRYWDGDDATVEVYDGAAWQVVWSDPNADLQAHHTWDVTTYASGNPNFQIRFNYQNAVYDYWFAVDNVVLSGQVNSSCTTGGGAVTVANGTESGTIPLTASKSGSDISVVWDASTTGCTSADYHLIWGWGADLGAYGISGSDCDPTSSGNFTWDTVPDTTSDWCWFLMVGDDAGTVEGGWGLNTALNQRSTVGSGECSTSSIDTTACTP